MKPKEKYQPSGREEMFHFRKAFISKGANYAEAMGITWFAARALAAVELQCSPDALITLP